MALPAIAKPQVKRSVRPTVLDEIIILFTGMKFQFQSSSHFLILLFSLKFKLVRNQHFYFLLVLMKVSQVCDFKSRRTSIGWIGVMTRAATLTDLVNSPLSEPFFARRHLLTTARRSRLVWNASYAFGAKPSSLRQYTNITTKQISS